MNSIILYVLNISLLLFFLFFFFFFNDTATTEIYTLSLHDALPILPGYASSKTCVAACYTHPGNYGPSTPRTPRAAPPKPLAPRRSITHRSQNLHPPDLHRIPDATS